MGDLHRLRDVRAARVAAKAALPGRRHLLITHSPGNQAIPAFPALPIRPSASLPIWSLRGAECRTFNHRQLFGILLATELSVKEKTQLFASWVTFEGEAVFTADP